MHIWIINSRILKSNNDSVWCLKFLSAILLCPWYHMEGSHDKIEPSKVQYSTPNYFDQLFFIIVYWNPKSKQGPNLACLACRGAAALTWVDLLKSIIFNSTLKVRTPSHDHRFLQVLSHFRGFEPHQRRYFFFWNLILNGLFHIF